jgi:hypothetical protein
VFFAGHLAAGLSLSTSLSVPFPSSGKARIT